MSVLLRRQILGRDENPAIHKRALLLEIVAGERLDLRSMAAPCIMPILRALAVENRANRKRFFANRAENSLTSLADHEGKYDPEARDNAEIFVNTLKKHKKYSLRERNNGTDKGASGQSRGNVK